MRKLSRDQKLVLAEFLANFSVAWLVAGIIAPFMEKKNFLESVKSGILPIIWAGVLVLVMLYLTKGGRK